MKKWDECLTSWFGLGYSPLVSGTVGTLGAIPLFYWLSPSWPILLLVTLVLFFLGVFVSNRVSERLKQKDPKVIVIDEVVGFLVAGLGHSFSLHSVIILFFLFRLFDIWKPFPVNRLEALPKGWGIMSDDLLAGVYANLLYILFMWIF